MFQGEFDDTFGVKSHKRTNNHGNRIDAAFRRLCEGFVDVLGVAQFEGVQLHVESFRFSLSLFEAND